MIPKKDYDDISYAMETLYSIISMLTDDKKTIFNEQEKIDMLAILVVGYNRFQNGVMGKDEVVIYDRDKIIAKLLKNK